MFDYVAITEQYYAEWLDCHVQDFTGGLKYIRSLKRDSRQAGYPSPYALFMCITNTAVIVSYSGKIRRQITMMKNDFPALSSFRSTLEDYLSNLFDVKADHHIKFVFERPVSYSGDNTVSLSKDDYGLFLDFNLSLGRTEWDGMRDYFERISELGYCIARMVDGKIVSVTDAPDMPYMSDIVQEIGINTLAEYRDQGHAKEVVSACISKVISDNKCPQWSCKADNHASENLAYSVGFKKFCDIYSITL